MALLDENDAEMLAPDFSDDEQGKKKRVRRKRSKKVKEEDLDMSGEPEERGVVYLSHIPHGFYEPQMISFFEQFGKVTRCKLWRSKKTGKSRGYAYIEFEYIDVAKIVADTMNNYLMFQKLLKCKFIPKKDLVAKAFSQCNRNFVKPFHRELSAKRHNSLLVSGESRILKNQKRLVQMEGRRMKKMAALGIEYKPTGYADEWEDIKKAKNVIHEKRRVEELLTKEITMRKEAALKKAKHKAHLLSKKRRIGKKLRRKEEKEKAAAAEKPEEPKTETSDAVTPKYPKRKSLDAVSGEVDQQPLKKKGRTSTLSTPAQKLASPPPKDEVKAASPAVKSSRRSSRRSVKGDAAAPTSPEKEVGSKTPKPKTPGSKTPRSKTPIPKTPKTIKEASSTSVKGDAAAPTSPEKEVSSKTPKPKTPGSKTPSSKTPSSKTPKTIKEASSTLGRKVATPSQAVSKPSVEDSPEPKMVKKTPRSSRRGRTPRKGLSLDSEATSDSDSGKPKVMEFAGIKLQVSDTPEVELKTPKASKAKTPKTAIKGSSKKIAQIEELEGNMTPKVPTSSKKGASAKKSAKKMTEINIPEASVLLF
ncbi:uncharacterized protein [Asterias amurensis]|uniref:uncharacterized protein n=1 Tax=Asterias amurensis TaxID=7602 RepID=UPI003AB20B78